MAVRSRDGAIYQSHYLTTSESFDVYSAPVREESAVTSCRYAFLLIVFVVNLSMSLTVLVVAVYLQPSQPKRWRQTQPASTLRGSTDWLVCRQCVDDAESTRPCCEVIDDDFCDAASKVLKVLSSLVSIVCQYFTDRCCVELSRRH